MDFRSPQARANDKPSYGSPYPPQPINGKSGLNVTRRERPHLGERKKSLQKTYFRIFDPGAKAIILGEIVNLTCWSISSVLRSCDRKITQGFEVPLYF
ncbi:hypothetical protein AVEN_121128-1 [Araneus ventricosus]|uniref:Uncharacterized protein n=1 Tax=Araneus ventricosus TaxID=182803 RepID=A0A4Y2MKC5_ARAVE|nr:hypothetical protein AVEN_121128-1 [Araneus ventricosus]